MPAERLFRRATPLIHRLDHAIARLRPVRQVLVELRTPVCAAILGPVVDAIHESEPAMEVWYTSEYAERMQPLVPAGRFLSQAQVEWRRFDVYLNADPWAAARLRRCDHRINFFHGVAGKYDLDSPVRLPMGYQYYSRVAFINRDRMERYLAAGVVTPQQAALVGYPKLDRLANHAFDGAAQRAALALHPDRPTALYAPTYSPASSLHLAGEEIARELVRAGLNVIVKLHDRSLDPDPRYSGGIDWRGRFTSLAAAHPGRIAYVETADASPLLAAADVMVTDHSSVGFEFLVLDRPLIVFDAPELAVAARINPEKIALLRSAATVVATARDVGDAVASALGDPARDSARRQQVARQMFFDPGGATARALQLIRELASPSRAVAASGGRPRASMTT
jgi:hypothetical protein